MIWAVSKANRAQNLGTDRLGKRIFARHLSAIAVAVLAPNAIAVQTSETKVDRKTVDVRKKMAAKAKISPLHEKSIDEILKRYTFVGDFDQKDPERPVSSEVFWRYDYKLPQIEFPIELALKDPAVELPATHGDGRAIDHLNRGRQLLLEGNVVEAKATWLSGRARYGTQYPFHRRDDYFIATAFLGLAEKTMAEKHVGLENSEVKNHLSNAATFLSWAYIVKREQDDALLDRNAPKAFYNLASIYWRYGRFTGALGAANAGLDFLRKTGLSERRGVFHRMIAEAHIRSRNYLEAVQQLDTAIRQDENLEQAAQAFARVGDIYFDLNNYELAEDAYALGAKIDEDLKRLDPAQLVLRGEALFWLGKFSEAQRVLHFALEGASYRKLTRPLNDGYAAFAALRLADAYLARKEFEKAKLEYYKVGREHRQHEAGRIAKIREACLELPYYKGHNVGHARDLLEETKAEPRLPRVAQELAWSCQVGSYTDRERTPGMLERVRAFAEAYPESGFLKSFVQPVREFQASRIEDYFAKDDDYRALSFFEKNRSTLFKKVDRKLASRLFAAYADVHRSEGAAEFWSSYAQEPDSDLKLLRQAVVAQELALKKAKGPWRQRDLELQKRLQGRKWSLAPTALPLAYFARMQQAARTRGHWRWLLALARVFGEVDKNLVCDLEYPVLSELYSRSGKHDPEAHARIRFLVKTELPDLFKLDESCALSMLELEASFFEKSPTKLGELYLSRADWPLVGGFLHLYWTMSEKILAAGEREQARRLWLVIREKAQPESPEVQFAKARLDPSRTESEKLWD